MFIILKIALYYIVVILLGKYCPIYGVICKFFRNSITVDINQLKLMM